MTGYQVRDVHKLTAREREVVDTFIANPSKSRVEVAQLLGITDRTLRTHMTHINAKTGASSIREVVINEIERQHTLEGLRSVRLVDGAIESQSVTALDVWALFGGDSAVVMTEGAYQQLSQFGINGALDR